MRSDWIKRAQNIEGFSGAELAQGLIGRGSVQGSSDGCLCWKNVVFFRTGNHIGTKSNFFCKAVAYQIYGDHSFNVRVKAEHLEILQSLALATASKT